MTTDIEQIKKKIIYRSNYRGTKEMDKLLGAFTNKYIDQLNVEDLNELIKFLEIDDNNLYNFYNGLDTNIEFLGKDNLIKIKKNGIEKKLMGVKINLDKINLRSAINLTINEKLIGEIRSAVFSPTFNKVIGIAMIKKPYFTNKGNFDISIDSKKYVGEICDIPFV